MKHMLICYTAIATYQWFIVRLKLTIKTECNLHYLIFCKCCLPQKMKQVTSYVLPIFGVGFLKNLVFSLLFGICFFTMPRTFIQKESKNCTKENFVSYDEKEQQQQQSQQQ